MTVGAVRRGGSAAGGQCGGGAVGEAGGLQEPPTKQAATASSFYPWAPKLLEGDLVILQQG